MRILLLTQWFDPEPANKGLVFAQELIRLGHEVEVLTGFPNYPGGKLYDGYKVRLVQREIMDGVPIIRVALYPSHDSSGLRRFANYLSFSLSAAILGPLLVKPADVAYVCQHPATIILPAISLRVFRGIAFVCDVQDLWPDSLVATGMFTHPIGLSLVQSLCNITYRLAAHIVVLSPGYKKVLCKRGVPADKIDVVYNWCEKTPLGMYRHTEDWTRDLGMAGRFNVTFAGTMGKAQALRAVLDAAAIVSKHAPIVQFLFIGAGVEVEQLKEYASRRQLNNVRFVPRVPKSEIGKVLRLADVLLVHLKEAPLFEITIPSKTQGYLEVGRPILMGVRGDAADLIEAAGAGIACTPEDPESIANGVLSLFSLSPAEREAMGAAGARFYREELSIAIGARRFEEVFAKAIDRRTPSGLEDSRR